MENQVLSIWLDIMQSGIRYQLWGQIILKSLLNILLRLLGISHSCACSGYQGGVEGFIKDTYRVPVALLALKAASLASVKAVETVFFC